MEERRHDRWREDRQRQCIKEEQKEKQKIDEWKEGRIETGIDKRRDSRVKTRTKSLMLCCGSDDGCCSSFFLMNNTIVTFWLKINLFVSAEVLR